MSYIFLTVPDDEMYSEVLRVILEATESKYGIFGYIDEQETLVIPSMSRDIWEECQVPDKTIVYPREKWGGIWGRALVEKKALYANGGLHLPSGHIPLERVICVPVVFQEKCIGLIEAANRVTDYGEEDREFLEIISAKIAPILNARLERDREDKKRKQAEKALRQSEEKYRTILEEMEEGYYEQDLAGNFTFVNKAMCRHLGYSRDELIGMNYRVYTPEDDVKKRYAVWNKVYQTGETVKELPLVNICKDGTSSIP